MSFRSRLWEVLNKEIAPRSPRPRPKQARPRYRAPFSGTMDRTFFRKRAKLRAQWTVFNQLNIILKANAPMAQGIGAAIYDAPSGRLARVLRDLRDRIETGMTLSEAMRAQRDFFPTRVCDLIHAGEVAGQPATAMQSVISEWEEWISRRSSVGLSVSYAFFLLVVQSAIMVFLLDRIVPVFAEIVGEFAGSEPAIVRIAQRAWSLLDAYPYTLFAILVGIVVAMAAGLRIYRRTGSLQAIFAMATCRVPILGRYIALNNLSFAARLLHRFIEGGIPLPVALQRVGDSDMNAGYARAFRRVGERIERGSTMRDGLEVEHRLLPKSFRALLTLGERSATVPDACGNLSILYAAELDRTRRVLADALVPLVAVIGGALSLGACLTMYSVLVAIIDSMLESM